MMGRTLFAGIFSIASLVVMAYGLYMIFQKKQATETDVMVIQRQLRGFAMQIVATFIASFAMVIAPNDLIK